MFRFEKLDVWRKAIDFADVVYSLTRVFPDVEKFGLVSQMRRAAVSFRRTLPKEAGDPQMSSSRGSWRSPTDP